MSAFEIKRHMADSRYNTILSVMLRIIVLMGIRDIRYQLNDVVESEGGFFETEVRTSIRSKLNRNKNSQRVANFFAHKTDRLIAIKCH